MGRERYLENWPDDKEVISSKSRNDEKRIYTEPELENIEDEYDYKEWDASDPSFKILFWGMIIILVVVLGLGIGLWRTNIELQALHNSNEQLKEDLATISLQLEEVRTVSSTSSTLGSPVKTMEYVVKRGDTLWQIAKDLLKDANRWREIADLNRLDNVDLAAGMRLLVPID